MKIIWNEFWRTLLFFINVTIHDQNTRSLWCRTFHLCLALFQSNHGSKLGSKLIDGDFSFHMTTTCHHQCKVSEPSSPNNQKKPCISYFQFCLSLLELLDVFYSACFPRYWKVVMLLLLLHPWIVSIGCWMLPSLYLNILDWSIWMKCGISVHRRFVRDWRNTIRQVS